MKRFRSILTVLLIFVCGVVVGGILAAAATFHDLVNKTFRDGPVNVRKVLLQRAKHDLQLDDDQAHQFWQVLTDTGGELRQAIEPIRPQLDAVLARAEQRMRGVLNNGQQSKFDAFMQTARERWQKAMQADASSSEAAPAEPPAP